MILNLGILASVSRNWSKKRKDFTDKFLWIEMEGKIATLVAAQSTLNFNDSCATRLVTPENGLFILRNLSFVRGSAAVLVTHHMSGAGALAADG